MEFSEEYIEEMNAIEILYLHMHVQQNRENENVENLGKILCLVSQACFSKCKWTFKAYKSLEWTRYPINKFIQ